MKIYLSGPIDYGNPLHWENTHVWRNRAERELGAENCLNPTRRVYTNDLTDEEVTKLVTDDLDEIERSDILLANIWKISPGTMMELFFARNILGIPVIVVCPLALRKAWIRYCANYIFDTLDKALAFIKKEYLNESTTMDSLDVARSG
jgi:nucleoside 2-deoxyribosyltransferase